MSSGKAEPNSAWRVEMFGGLRLAREGDAAVRFRTRKTAALLAYLAFFSDRAHPREVLIDLFWPEAHLDAGRQSLRMALSSLRESFGQEAESLLLADRNEVRLLLRNSDVAEFEEGAASEDLSILTKALRRVKGPLLTGFDDSWIVAQWLRLEESYAQAAVRAMELSTGDDLKAGIVLGKEAVALLGPREDVHVALMRLFAASGQPALAIAQFEELERSLQEQWGESPSSTAYQVLDALPKGGRAPLTPAASPVPTRLSSFYGREREVAQVKALLTESDNRLTTLTGIGGSGKTSLANVVARDLTEHYKGRIWILELADTRDPLRLLKLLHQCIVGANDSVPTVESVAQVIGQEAALVVADNFEQLLPGGPSVVKALLGGLPNCRFLVTSRVPLNVDGEQLYSVPPLPVPQPALLLQELKSVPSVALFVDRASSVNSNFRLDASNASAIGEICRRLEGLPLALELAAAKALTHSPAQILARIGGTNEFLTSRRSDVSDRQRSLAATLDWSLSLLPPETQKVYESCGVFRGTFDLLGVAAVSATPQYEGAFDLLLQSSLVVHAPGTDTPRFRMLEPVREHAGARNLGETGKTLRRRHFEHFREIVHGLESGEPGARNKNWLDRLDTEHENLCAAFESVFDGVCSPKEAVDFVLSARPFFRPRGKTSVWRSLTERLKLEMLSSTDTATKAKLWLMHAQMSANVVDAETLRAQHEEAAELCRQSKDLDGLGQALAGLAGTYKVSGDYPKSIELYEKAISAFHETGNSRHLASTMRQMSMSYVSMGDHEKTYETLKLALPYAREAGEPDALAWTLTDLGVEHALHGFAQESSACFSEAHGICEASENSHMRSIVFWQEAETFLRTGNAWRSVELHKRCVDHALRGNFKEGLKWMLLSFGAALVSAGLHESGTRTMAKGVAWRENENRPLTGDEHEILVPAKAGALQELGGEAFQSAWDRGAQADLEVLIAELLALKGPGVTENLV